MELRHLRYFVAVAEELNFGRAAERLYVSQSPLSHQILQLEAEFGVKLIDRSRRQIQLTDAGKIFAIQARNILAQAEQAKGLAVRASRGEMGQLRVGCMTPTHGKIAINILRMFANQHPDVHLELKTLSVTEQVEALHNKSIDVGILRLPVKGTELNFQVIHREPFVVVMSEDNPLSKRKRVPLSALANQPYITFQRLQHPWLYDYIVGLCNSAGFTLNIVREQSDVYSILALIAANVGVHLIGASAKDQLQIGGIVFRELQSPAPRVELAVAYGREDPSSVVSQFLRVVSENVGHN